MSEFNSKYTHDANEDMVFFFSGMIDSKAQFPSLRDVKEPIIRIDLGDVKMMNSGGIRTWILWIEKYREKQFSFYRIPTFFTNHLQLVDNLIPKDSNIASFFVPYFCPQCDLDNDLLFYRDKEFTNSGEVVLLVKATCAECTVPMEPSIHVDSFFRALNLRPPQAW